MYIPNYVVKVRKETYIYCGWEDRGDDVIKIFHDIKDGDGNIFNGPWSPYQVPTLEQFTEFVTDVEENRLHDTEDIRKEETYATA